MDLIGVKISHSLGVGDDVAVPESVVGIRELWWGFGNCGGDSGAVVWGFLYVFNSFCTISKL